MIILKKGYVLFSQKDGVYLGNFMGLGFWSFLDPVGQDAAYAFTSKDEAIEHGKTILPSEVCQAIEVEIDTTDGYASIKSCVRSGLPMWNPNGQCVISELN